jgi:hypothetical protein
MRMWRRRADEIAIACFTIAIAIGVGVAAAFRNCEYTNGPGWIPLIIGAGFFAVGAVAGIVNRDATGRPVMRYLVLLTGGFAVFLLMGGCAVYVNPYSGCPTD